jgi:perosamine synthetase
VTREFKTFNTIGNQELQFITEVLNSSQLSNFYGEWSPQFYGGKFVGKLEEMAKEYFGVKHAVTFNSWTSGLVAAVGAIGINPGDEVIVTPWTMSATAMAILHWNAIPIFVDIDPKTYCIDADKVAAAITPRTKAIMPVDIFGQSAETEKIMDIANKKGIKVISDSAQSPGATRHGKFAGTLSHIGGISLNYHKHIHSGEGGILFTDDDELALRAQLIRNHAESVVQAAGVKNLNNMIGHNFRMTELQAAVGVAQLPKLDQVAKQREKEGQYLTENLKDLPGFIFPKVLEGNSHVYYTYGFQIDQGIVKKGKAEIIEDLSSNGVPGLSGSYPLVHLLPIFQEKTAYGDSHFPWSIHPEHMKIDYAKGTCPVAENLIDRTFIQFYLNAYQLSIDDLEFIVGTIRDRWPNYLT